MSVSEAYNFKTVTDELHTAGLLGESQLACLQAEGYSSVVNLLPDDSEYAISNERQIVESQGLGYYYIPVDFSAPSNSDFLAFTNTMTKLPSGKKLLHCAANYRVSAFFAIYAYRRLGWSEAEARTFIASVWDLPEHPVWDNFVSQMICPENS